MSIDPGGSGSIPRPLSVRESGATLDAALYEGVPGHLAEPLRTWVSQFLASGNLRDRVAARLRIDPPEPGAWWAPDVVEQAEGRLLDIIDMALLTDRRLHFEVEVLGMVPDEAAGAVPWIEPAMWPSSSLRARHVQALDDLLEDGRSVYTVWWETPLRLVRRTDPTTQSAVEQVLTDAGTTVAALLRQAWSSAYAPTPDPNAGYRDAVRVVEAAIAPVVSPNNDRQTLGTAVHDLRNGAHHYELVLLDKTGDGAIEPLLVLLERLWEGQKSRHGAGFGARDQTVAEARAAVQVAVLAVQWLSDGALRHRGGPGTP